MKMLQRYTKQEPDGSGPLNLIIAARTAGGVKRLETDSRSAPPVAEWLFPFTLAPQCYQLVFAGLTGDYTGISQFTDGSLYLVAYQHTGDWSRSDFSPPGIINRTPGAPIVSGGYTYTPGFDANTQLYFTHVVCPILSVTAAGSGFSDGLHSGQATSGGSGSGLTVDLFASGGACTSAVVSGIGSSSPGSGYLSGDNLTSTGGVHLTITGWRTAGVVLLDSTDYFLCWYAAENDNLSRFPPIAAIDGSVFTYYATGFAGSWTLGINAGATATITQVI
jgi:hypothetical protein